MRLLALYRTRIGIKLNVLFLCIVTIVLLISGAYNYWMMSEDLHRRETMERSALLARLSASLPNSLWELDDKKIKQTITSEMNSGVVRGIVVADNYSIFVGMFRNSDNSLVDALESTPIPAGLQMEQVRLKHAGLEGNGEIGTIKAYWTNDAINATLKKQVFFKLSEILLLDCLLILALSRSLHVVVLQPLEKLRRALLAAAKAKMGEPIKVPDLRNDEFGEVAAAFNRTSNRLMQDLQRLKVTEEARANTNLALQRALKETHNAFKQLQSTQASLVQAEKMAALGGLVAGVAHEINTPVGVALTGASILAQETQSLARLLASGAIRKTDLLAYVQVAQESTLLLLNNIQRAADLIQSFKRVAVDQTSEARRLFNLHDYIADVLASLHPALKRSNVQVTVECPDGLMIDGYPGAFSQIITNLVMNALIHAYSNREAGVLQLIIRREDKMASLDFIDQGNGIAADILPRIFDPFFTTTRGSGGSGLGLNIVYNLTVRTLGGRIDVKSTLGQGTCFSLTFPLTSPQIVAGDPV